VTDSLTATPTPSAEADEHDPALKKWEEMAAWTIEYAATTDELFDILEDRLAALEEVAAARWPARILVRARLGRKLRQSIAPFAGPSFRDRRHEAVTTEWLSR
jgi:hypothetical protein